MNFTYEHLGSGTYLVYEIQDGDQLDSMSLGMMTNNTIPGFAGSSFSQMDEKKYIKYNISSKVAVSTLLGSPVNKKRLLAILSGLVDAMLTAENYMLDPASIMLDLDYIFTDVTTCEPVLICLPILHENEQTVDVGKFFKDMVFYRTQFDQTEDCTYVATLFNYLNSVPVITLLDFKALLDKLRQQKQEIQKQKPEVKQLQYEERKPEQKNGAKASVPDSRKKQEPIKKEETPAKGRDLKFGKNYNVSTETDKSKEKAMSLWYLLQHYNKDNARLYKEQQAAKKESKDSGSADLGFMIPGEIPLAFDVPGAQNAKQEKKEVKQAEKAPAAQHQIERRQIPIDVPTYEEDAGDLTTVNPEAGPSLVRVKTGEVIELNKAEFKIGRKKKAVDYAITDNDSISKEHVVIKFVEGSFQVEDTDSLNHTYINGKRIPKNQPVPINSGDILKLSNEEFECHLF